MIISVLLVCQKRQHPHPHPAVIMEYIRASPAKLLHLTERFTMEADTSLRILSSEKQRQLEALNLSARKILRPKSRTVENKNIARPLFKVATLGSSISLQGSHIRDKLQENVKNIKEVLDSLPSPKTISKRKYSAILNDNRGNYEAVDLSIDLCCVAEDQYDRQHKKLRMSV